MEDWASISLTLVGPPNNYHNKSCLSMSDFNIHKFDNLMDSNSKLGRQINRTDFSLLRTLFIDKIQIGFGGGEGGGEERTITIEPDPILWTFGRSNQWIHPPAHNYKSGASLPSSRILNCLSV